MQTTKQTALATSKAVDILLLILLSTLWGASYTFIRVGVETIPPVTLIAARTLIAGLLLIGWMSVSGVACRVAGLYGSDYSYRLFLIA